MRFLAFFLCVLLVMEIIPMQGHISLSPIPVVENAYAGNVTALHIFSNNTSSIKLDKSIYPVPFGTVGASAGSSDFNPPGSGGVISTNSKSQNGVFPLHQDVVSNGITYTNVLKSGNVMIHARINDADYDLSANIDKIAVGINDAEHGPVSFQISRNGQSMLLATAGGPAIKAGKIINLNGTSLPPMGDRIWSYVRDLGPLMEIAPTAGIFQTDLSIKLTDGPASVDCPKVDNYDGTINGMPGFSTLQTSRFYSAAVGGNYCVRQGDILSVTYADVNNPSGMVQTITDSATFDLRSGTLQSDKSVYVLGSDLILTLVEPDLNLDSQTTEAIPLDLVEWNSQEYKGTLGPLGNQTTLFNPVPSELIETGKDTGIFQSVIKISNKPGMTFLPGDKINLEYTDWGPTGSKTVGNNKKNVDLQFSISPFTILFKSGPVFLQPGINIPAIKGHRQPFETVHFLLQFTTLPNYLQRTQIENQGINLTDYVTGHTYISSAKVSDLNKLLTISNIQSASPFDPTYKVSPVLMTNLSVHAPWAIMPNPHGPQVVLTINLNKDANLTKAAQSITGLGGTIESTTPAISTITAFFNIAGLHATINKIAELDAVQFINVVDPPLSPHNDQVRNNTNLNSDVANPILPDGFGITAFVYDQGTVDYHSDLVGDPNPCPGIFPIPCRVAIMGIPDPQPHTTEVAGTLGGSGLKSIGYTLSGGIIGTHEQWKGVAPKISIISASFTSGSCAATCPLYNDNSDLATDFTDAENNALGPSGHVVVDLATMSLGVNVMKFCYDKSMLGDYQQTSNTIDNIVTGQGFPQKLLFFESAGNNLFYRTQCPLINYKELYSIDPPAAAKDSIAVGSINSTDYKISQLTDFGPTTNGYRIKPDIVSPGCRSDSPKGIVSTFGTSDYHSACGTSLSSPAAAGVAAVLIEKWKMNSGIIGNIPSPHTIKAILIHTAVDLENPGPDYKTGWGDVNAKAALDLINDDAETKLLTGKKLINNDTIDSGQQRTFQFVSDGSEDVRATLVWDDPASPVVSNGLLQNSLDLTLVDPEGTSYDPYLLYPLEPTNDAGKGNDNLNNVKIADGNAIKGKWMAIVTTDSIPAGPQNFTLIISHTYKRSVDLSISPINPTIKEGNPITFTIHASDSDTGIPLPLTGTVSWDDGNKDGKFLNGGIPSNVCQLSSGSCSIQYLQDNKGPYIITATLHDQTHQHPPVFTSLTVTDCLIATVAFGSEIAPQVQFLRDFRDDRLLTTSVGSNFMNVFNNWYYSFSPSVANYENQNPVLREVVKVSLYPLLGILLVSEKAFTLFNGNYGAMASGLVAISMMGSVYISPLMLLMGRVRNGKSNLRLASFILVGFLVSSLFAILSGNQTSMMITVLLFLLSLMTLTALVTAKLFVKSAKKVRKIFGANRIV